MLGIRLQENFFTARENLALQASPTDLLANENQVRSLCGCILSDII